MNIKNDEMNDNVAAVSRRHHLMRGGAAVPRWTWDMGRTVCSKREHQKGGKENILPHNLSSYSLTPNILSRGICIHPLTHLDPKTSYKLALSFHPSPSYNFPRMRDTRSSIHHIKTPDLNQYNTSLKRSNQEVSENPPRPHAC